MKRLLFLLLVPLLLVTAFPAGAAASVQLDEGIIRDSRTLLPLRSIFEALDADVHYEAADKSITATSGKDTIYLKIGSKTARKNSQTIQLDTAPLIQNSRTYVPGRFISESLGASVDWNNTTKTMEIRHNGNVFTVPTTVQNVWGKGLYRVHNVSGVRGGLTIQNETSRSMDFVIDVAYSHVGYLQGTAVKNGTTAVYGPDRHNCTVTFTRTGSTINVNETPGCQYHHGVGISFAFQYRK
ncbi:hypothetical protein C6I21_07270 [Alkalicoccus urumqiensis]|uniref:Copper amine oxidase-like N-terminal domain-containing protein n=2 Tax=Alkalicoccus urumqiensis TaxID=1548213 RepID=A0A2P6MIK2_ALKUR|nr:hypothetical protein C6I21_07270 [Alkalicoccus urumqiensis]